MSSINKINSLLALTLKRITEGQRRTYDTVRMAIFSNYWHPAELQVLLAHNRLTPHEHNFLTFKTVPLKSRPLCAFKILIINVASYSHFRLITQSKYSWVLEASAYICFFACFFHFFMVLWFYGSLWTDLVNERMNEWIAPLITSMLFYQFGFFQKISLIRLPWRRLQKKTMRTSAEVLEWKYTVSQKKTSPTFLAITRESIDGFL